MAAVSLWRRLAFWVLLRVPLGRFGERVLLGKVLGASGAQEIEPSSAPRSGASASPREPPKPSQ